MDGDYDNDDADGDGWSADEGDCDDYLVSVHPLGVEDCDAAGDEDCNGLADADDPACGADTGIGIAGDSGGGGDDSGGSSQPDGGPDDDAGVDLGDTAGPGSDGSSAAAGAPSDKDACAGCATLDDHRPLMWWAMWVFALTRRRP